MSIITCTDTRVWTCVVKQTMHMHDVCLLFKFYCDNWKLYAHMNKVCLLKLTRDQSTIFMFLIPEKIQAHMRFVMFHKWTSPPPLLPLNSTGTHGRAFTRIKIKTEKTKNKHLNFTLSVFGYFYFSFLQKSLLLFPHSYFCNFQNKRKQIAMQQSCNTPEHFMQQ